MGSSFGTLGIDGDGGSDILDIRFLNPGSYEIKLIANTCSTDSISKTIVIDPIPNLGLISDSFNVCGPDTSFFFLTPETYLNPDSTEYSIRIYGGEGILLDVQNYTQFSLPTDSIMLDVINLTSCDFIYNDSTFNGAYKVEVLAFNKCDSFAVDTFKVYFSEAIISSFDIDNTVVCEDSIYTFVNAIDDKL